MHIKIGNKIIGDGYPTYIVAEISGNHNGCLEEALNLIRAAKNCGADAVKLQTYRADTITLDSDAEDFSLKTGPWSEYSNLYQLYDKAHTPWEWHQALFEEAQKLNIEIFSSPFDESAVDFLEKFNVVAYKIASPEINHIPLLIKVARTKKPVILSTGVASEEDLVFALETLRKNGCEKILVLKCTSTYPAPIEEANLATIPDMKKRYGVCVGLSDHTEGILIPIIATTLGAHLIEKHISMDHIGKTVDSFFSLDEKEFSKLVQSVRKTELAIGKPFYEITDSAKQSIKGRRSLYVSQDIKAGDLLTNKNIKCIRPSFGLHPKYYFDILGKRARTDLVKGDRLTWEVIEGSSL